MYLNLNLIKRRITNLVYFSCNEYFSLKMKKIYLFIQNKRIFNIYKSFGSKGPVPVRYTDFQKVFKTFGYHCTISLMSSMLKKSRTWMHIPTPFFAWIFFCLNLSDIEMKLKNYIEVCSEIYFFRIVICRFDNIIWYGFLFLIAIYYPKKKKTCQ